MLTNGGQTLTERAKISAGMEAIVDVASGVRYSYRELNARTNQLANTLLTSGFLPGERVACLVSNQPHYVEFQCPDGHSVLVLAEGRLLNLGCATGHPSFVMSASFTNQVLAQIELHANAEKIGKQVLMLPKKLDEEVARLHLAKLGVKLTKLSDEQAKYIGVSVDGPYKPEHYRY